MPSKLEYACNDDRTSRAKSGPGMSRRAFGLAAGASVAGACITPSAVFASQVSTAVAGLGARAPVNALERLILDSATSPGAPLTSAKAEGVALATLSQSLRSHIPHRL